MTDVEDLSEEEQFKVFWLQGKLFEEGIDGIRFTEKMREYLEGQAENDLERAVNSELSKKDF